MGTKRSPNYPRLSFEEALEKVRMVYDELHTYPADKEVISKSLGYGSLNGGSAAMIAGLNQYDLLEKTEKEYKVSDDAVSILELSETSQERSEAINSLIFRPDILSELHNKYGEKLPQNSLMRHFLIQKKYLPKAATEIIRIYRANLEFVNPLNSDYNSDTNTESEQKDVSSNKMEVQQVSQSQTPPIAMGGSQVVVNISADGELDVTFSGEVNEQTFDVLNGIREIQKKNKKEESL